MAQLSCIFASAHSAKGKKPALRDFIFDFERHTRRADPAELKRKLLAWKTMHNRSLKNDNRRGN